MILQINSSTHALPTTWNELSLTQQYQAYQILLQDIDKSFLPEESIPLKRILLMSVVCPAIDNDFINQWENDCLHNLGEEEGKEVFAAELQEVSRAATKFFFEEVQDEQNKATLYTINLSLTKCPYPFVEIPSGRRQPSTVNRSPNYKLHAPADDLANISIYELATAFTIFETYVQNKDEQLINTLLATIYRPHKPRTKENIAAGYEGDVRLPYLKHESTVKRREKYFEKIPPLAKALILFWFASCRHQIIQAYPNVFSKKTDEYQLRENPMKKYGWSAILMQLAGGIVHLDAIAAQNHANALTYLSFLEDQRREQEDQALLK